MKRPILILLAAALGPLALAGSSPAWAASSPAAGTEIRGVLPDLFHDDGYHSHRHHPRHDDGDDRDHDDGHQRCRAIIAICLL